VKRPCIVCGDHRVHAQRRCNTDYRYWRRHGHDRPFELIAAATRRDIEREAAARITAGHTLGKVVLSIRLAHLSVGLVASG